MRRADATVPRRGRRAGAVALVVVLVLAVLTGLLWGLQRRLVYLPDDGPVPAAATVLPGARDVTLRTSDGLALGAWFLPGPAPEAPAVLVANGNGGHRGYRAPLAEALADRGLAVLLFDYRGYGGNPGSPSEEGLALDVRAARAYLVEQAGVPPGRLVYVGESLGAAVVTELAVEHPPAGLLLRSPFVDLATVGSVHYPFLPVRALLRDRYPVAEALAQVRAPTTVVYGSRDSIVPPEQSRAVAAAATDLVRLVEVPGADHNDRALLDGAELVAAVVELAGRAR
ncbi:MAG TPA: alpha/beta fold hydrolase [Geodermatophilus sp.]|nr:alpha/beta fold hydrolase [Geodermatophilus sp.]